MVDAESIGFISEGACSGECCRLITLSAEPEYVAVLAAGARYARSHFAPHVHLSWDAEFVEANFIPVRRSQYDGVTGERLCPSFPSRPAPATQYRCVQWDGRTKRCMSYESRPGLCKRYGITSTCPRHDCTLRAYPITLETLRWEGEGGPQHPQEVQANG